MFLFGCLFHLRESNLDFWLLLRGIGLLSRISRIKFSAEGHCSNSMDLIDITSSDSENEVSIEKETSLAAGFSTSPIPRMIPSQASTSTCYNGSSQKPLLLERASPSNERSANRDHYSRSKLQMIPSYSDQGKTSNQESSLMDNAKYSIKNGNTSQPMNFVDIENLGMATDSRNNEMLGTASGKVLSQQNSRRIIPPSLNQSAPSTKSKTSLENGTSSYIPDNHGKSYQSYHNDDDVIMYENRGSRLLPPSLMQVKSTSSLYSSSSDPAYHLHLGEERSAENDERVIFQAALQDLSQPKVEATLPDGLLVVPLLRHQKIALAWMLQKETLSTHCLGGILADDQGLGKTISTIALIQMQMRLQSKYTSDDQCTLKPEPLSLDDDDDDNGVSDFVKIKYDGESSEVKKIPKVVNAVPAFCKVKPSAGTLVVCPASILRQWDRELNDKVADSSKLKVLIYHGGSRTKDPIELAKYDVVLTTYSIVTNEVPKQALADDDDGDQRNGEKCGLSPEFSTSKKRKKMSNTSKKGKKGRKETDGSSHDFGCGALARVVWFRVVLDEAQTIKNHRTQVARACCGLRAKRRWCLSGTPMQNSIDDLYSYFRFLKYDPYAVYKNFYLQIKIPISRDAPSGYKKLQAILKTIMLRRTKGTLLDGEPIIKLPPKSVYLTKVEFSTEERAFYLNLEADSRLQFKKYAAAGTVNQNYANILLMLLRLRQACDHPRLVKEYHSDPVGKASLEMARKLPRDMLVNLLNRLEASLAICGICSDPVPPEEAVVTMCGHVFCYQCVSEYLTGDDNQCPADECRESLGSDIVFSGATLRSCIFDENDGNSNSLEVAERSVAPQSVYSSSKIRAAIEILQSLNKSKNPSSVLSSQGCGATGSDCCFSDASDVQCVHSSPRTEGRVKAIVFSQWTSMLDLLQSALNDTCMQYRRLDGTMSLPSRDKAVKDFNTDPEVTVMLMSLKAGNLGLNMVAACHVILLDLWWNPTTEDQAVDRAHRIGQTRPVTVSRITVKDTVEDRILALQEEKKKMVASAFGEDQAGGSATRLTVEDLRYLFMV
ncbi:helicase-like transcription factor CHR28 [Telopea speciosissima]|uniref:helicase-like transcription factor CHR28 n=1 Tax=Telopea speciosissima TaxID=54955 RepID=UPI001CC7EDB8|nr:helicase-like transcription factor CHR28 [Telopea speciosissima]